MLLPTPTAAGYGSNQSPSPGAATRPSLARLAGQLLPTPVAGGGTGYRSGDRRDVWRPGLQAAVLGEQPRRVAPRQASLLPTPRGSDTGSPGRRAGEGFRPPLSQVLLPTPRSSDARGPAPHGDGGADLRTTVAHYLPTPRASDGPKGSPAQRGSKGDATLPSTAVAAAHEPGPAWGPYAAAIGRWEQVLARPAPEPTQPGQHGRPVLAPSFVEWLMGLPRDWVCGIGLPRTVALRVLGNGVVPQQAAAALRALLARHLTAGARP